MRACAAWTPGCDDISGHGDLKAGFVSAIQNQLNQMVGGSSGYLESLPRAVRKRVHALQELQEKHDGLKEQYLEELAALEAKFQALYAPLYEKRADIVTGVVEPEVENFEDEEGDGDAAAKGEAKESEDIVGIPEFWLTAMRNHEVLEEQITERDEGALKYLKDIKCTTLNGEEEKGFRLDFYFLPNPYFSNGVLSKTYLMIDDEEPILERAEGTEIQWHPGKNLCVKIMKKKPKKGGKNAKPITKTEPCESFFVFFSPPKVPGEDVDLDEQEAEELQDLMEGDYEVGAVLKDKIIPDAVSWFTGEALQGGDYDDLDDGDDDEDYDEDEEDDEEEEESEEEEEKRGKGGKGGAKNKKEGKGRDGKNGEGAPAEEQPPECKQQ
eukprot:jgi/Mesvir1/18101/Mv09398-RA.2